MVTDTTDGVLRHLRRAVLLHDGAGLTDGQLLGAFVERREDAAFAALVRRHGPMVWGVCRRLLPHHHAEDAFQAVFLVLARKAAAVAPRELVGNWLYGVAHQTALHARRTAARRTRREKQVTTMPEPPAADRDPWADVQPVLDEELSRLPDRYRAVIVLCDLEGKTRREVARQLGVPDGTVGSRLARARAVLADRLARRGVVLGGAVAAVLVQSRAAAVPPAVVASTIQAACVHAAGRAAAGAIPASVVALTQGVLKMMLVSKLKTATAVLLALALVGGGLLTNLAPATGQSPTSARPVPAAPDDAKKGDEAIRVPAIPAKPGMVAGTVGEVDADKNLLTVYVPTTVQGINSKTDKLETGGGGKAIELHNLRVGKGTKISVKGKDGDTEAKLTDLAVGDKVFLHLDLPGARIVVNEIVILRTK